MRLAEKLEYIQEQEEFSSKKKIVENGELVVFFDGSCNPNPLGAIGTGVVIYEAENFKVKAPGTPRIKSSYDKLKIIKKLNGSVPEGKNNTNNSAEHIALTTALSWLVHSNTENKKIFVFGDSKMIINQMNGLFSISPEKAYYQFAVENIRLLSVLSKNNTIKFIWIPREFNSKADELSKLK